MQIMARGTAEEKLFNVEAGQENDTGKIDFYCHKMFTISAKQIDPLAGTAGVGINLGFG